METVRTTITGYRLSPQQQRLWALQCADQSKSYRAVCVASIEGHLDIGRIKSAIRRILERHEILRTTFHRVPGVKLPLQVIREVSTLPSFEFDSIDRCEPQCDIQSLLEKALVQRVDFERSLPLQVSLSILSPQSYWLVISLPALCADAVALNNIVFEIALNYAIDSDQASDAEPVQYADVSEALNELLESEETKKEVDYWFRRPISQLAELKLPLENEPAERPIFRPQFLSLKVEPEVAARVAALARRQEAPVALVFLACWQTLLWRLTGQAEIVIGASFEGRTLAGFEHAVGLFAKYLPIYSCHDERLQFADFLKQTSDEVRKAGLRQDYFSWIRVADTENDRTEPQGFSYCFEFEQRPAQSFAREASFTTALSYTCIDSFKVKIRTIQISDSFLTEFHYATGYYVRSDIERLAEEFHKLLHSIVYTNDVIGRLGILGEIERRQALAGFNSTDAEYVLNRSVHSLIDEQACRSPHKIAVSFENESISYEELARRSNQLARFLARLGVGPEVRIAICLRRSIDMVITVLGVLKAGGAYVPLDPTYPAQRVSFMLEDAQAQILLTQQMLIPTLRQANKRVINLDEARAAIDSERDENVVDLVTPENPAYVIYTSGSTGQPKGAVITHRSLCCYVQAIRDAVVISSDDVYLHTASFAFSSSVRQLFVPLSHGASVAIASPEQISDPLQLFIQIKICNVTIIDLVPSYWRACVQTLKSLDPSSRTALLDNSMRLVLSASESLLTDLLENWASVTKHPACLINMLGHTETTGIVAVYPDKINSLGKTSIVPVGRPIANTAMYVLDDRLEPAPIGSIGELSIAGEGLARGYLDQPSRTAEQFTPHPFSHIPGKRLYRTGDLARFDSQGVLSHLGRADQQVKVRGYRVELGEIEAVLGQETGVKEAVAVTKGKGNQQKLMCYVVMEREHRWSEAELRSKLMEKLPEYMVPARIVAREEMPRTGSGKVDRRALSEEASKEVVERAMGAGTVGMVEELMAGIWGEVLGQEEVRVDGNFFEQGGHSLSAMQVVSRVREVMGVELALRDIFEKPTIGELAQRVDEAIRSSQGRKSPPIIRASRDGEIPLSFAQQRLLFIDQLEPGNSAYNIHSTLMFEGALKVEALRRALKEEVRRHEVLRTRFESIQGKAVQVIDEAWEISLPLIDLSELREEQGGDEARRLGKKEVQTPFDLSKGPLLRGKLLKLGERRHVLLFTIHHIVSDGWSMEILIREMGLLYNAYSAGEASPLPELQIQYADYAKWQREWLQGEVLERELGYWKRQMNGAPTLFELPTYLPRPSVQSYRGRRQSFSLSTELLAMLRELSRREDVTLFMSLLAAFKAMLYRYSWREDVLVGTGIANRNYSETESLIGFFVNMLVLRTDLSGNPTFIELLARVREVALGAYAHQDMPFDLLVEQLQPKRDLSRTPLFQVAFVLQTARQPTLELPGLRMVSLSIENTMTHFDLTMLLEEKPQGLFGALAYNTDLFESEVIMNMLRNYIALLEAMVAHPEQRVLEAPLYVADESSFASARNLQNQPAGSMLEIEKFLF